MTHIISEPQYHMFKIKNMDDVFTKLELLQVEKYITNVIAMIFICFDYLVT